MTIHLQLDIFEGPLDLLLYLIRKDDLDISKVSMVRVTDQYLNYLEGLQELDVDAASDYLTMAAELAHIKSRALLPRFLEEGDETEDPANDLIARLKEFECFKMAALDLKDRTWLNRDVFARGAFVCDADGSTGAVDKKTLYNACEGDTFELVKIFAGLLARLPREQRDYQVAFESASVTDRIYEIFDGLKKRDNLLLTDLLEKAGTRMNFIVTFLALLEMVRLRMIRVCQAATYGSIRVQRRSEASGNVLEDIKIRKDLASYR